MPTDDLRTLFAHPAAEHSACPFWFWNGELEPGELLRQVHLMYDRGVLGFVIHGREGLGIEYLSEDWFDRCRLVIAEAARLGMKVWIYDDLNWPSGYAGGRVVARDPSYRGQNVGIERHYVAGPDVLRLELDRPDEVVAVGAARIAEVRPKPADPLRVHHLEADGPDDWSDISMFEHTYAEEPPLALAYDPKSVTWEVPEGRWCVTVARRQDTDWMAVYSAFPYTDLINDGATTAFIEETHDEYYRRFEEYFGDTVIGFFVDEPGFYNNFWDRNPGSIPWTGDLAEQFAGRRGYDLLPLLPGLWEDLGARSHQLRADFWQTIAELLDERFFGKLARWCEARGVLLTGHLEWEEWLFTMTRHSASPFRALAPFQVPALDRIDEVTDKLTEKLVSSIAHLNGRSRVLSETFALAGWKLAPAYMKRIVDYQYVRGVSWLSCHGFYYSIEGHRRYECPPSEFFQNPWWEHSGPLWTYVSRLSAVLSAGQHVAPVALFYPIDAAWAELTPTAPGPFDGSATEPWELPERGLALQRTDLAMIRLGQALLESQWDFDLLDHVAVEEAKLDGALLRTGGESFRAVLVPPLQTISGPALGQLLAFAESGGTVVFVEDPPVRTVWSDPPEGWATARSQLLALRDPGYVPYGRGRLGYVPDGVGAVCHLLAEAVTPDVVVDLGDADGALVIVDETRRGGRKDTTIRRPSSFVRYLRRQVGADDVYFLVNESGHRLSAHLRLAAGDDVDRVEEWDPSTGDRWSHAATVENSFEARRHVTIDLAFEPWQTRLLVLTGSGAEPPSPARPSAEVTLALDDWELQAAGRTFRGPLRSWHELGLARYSGTGRYTCRFRLPTNASDERRVVLDLGTVLETAQVLVNGQSLSPLAFPPYRVDITEHVRNGDNLLQIKVANTNTNAFEQVERPSGLIGPVSARISD
jgi:alpha-L-rhamnosidase